MKTRFLLPAILLCATFAVAPRLRAEGSKAFDEAPTPLRTTAPAYPGDLRSAGINGMVAISVLIDEKGNVTETAISKSTHAGFEKPAIDAVTQWKFKPATKDGQPVAVRVVLPVKFIASS